MIHFKKFFLFTLLFFFAGCASDEPQGLSDAELIQAIIDADNKIEVDMESLPSSARSTMEDGYLSEYYHLQSLKASMLGYEVSIAGKPGRLGKRSEIYFDVDGKKLDYSEYEKDSWFYDDDFYNRSESGDKRDWECFSIEYPITVTTPNGNTYTFEDEESVKEYYEAYEIDEDISVVYPINITDNDGELIVIDSDERLEEAYKDCYGRGRDWVENKKCFSLVYPVSYLMPDGTTIEISADDEESWTELKSWYDDNPNSDERPSLQYPVDIIYEIDVEEGTQDVRVVTINSEDEMTSAKEECREMWGEYYDDWEERECFELVYPVSYLMPDGTTIEISADDEESWTELKSWYDDNPNSDERPSLQYPVDIIYEIDVEEGTQDVRVVTINSEDEMTSAKEECREMWGEYYDDWEERECFELVYPVSYLMPDGTTIEISADDEESWAEYKSWYDDNPESDERPSLQYPVEITYRTEEGTETQIINSEEEMISAKEECREVENEEDEGYECYEYVYPITFILPDESTVEISGEDDESGWGLIRRFYEQNPNYEEEPALQFPVEVVVEGDMVLVIDTSEDWEVFIEENCDRQE